MDWDFVHFAQQPIPARGLSLAGTLIEGPLRPDGSDGREPFDVDGEAGDDFGVIGIGLGHTQGYVYQVDITGEFEGPPDFSETVTPLVLDAIPLQFAIDPDGEDFQFDDMIDGICNSEVCDGIIADAACPVSITEPTDSDQTVSAALVIETDGLVVGQTCTTTVFVATQQASGGKGKGKKRAKFEPVSCVTAVSDSGIQITDTIALNHDVKIFDGTTNDLLAGPIDSIQLMPIGCP